MFDFLKRLWPRPAPRTFPAAWLDVLERRVPLHAQLAPSEREELQRRILAFLDRKTFEGCAGFEVTDEVRVTVAAHACLLLLHRDDDAVYPGLESILIYPTAYGAPNVAQQLPDGTVVEGHQGRLGESSSWGAVVLSWEDVVRGADDARDGHNVALHEFAHQLDQEDGRADGAPVLAGGRSAYAAWARALAPEFERLQRDVERGRRTTIDGYGATNPAEFFAVVTEAFFERPRRLQRKHPELYAELARFYRRDPLAQE